MRRGYDQMDMLVAACLAACIALWAFVWAHPYPHPDLWPFLVALGNRVGLTALGITGKIGLGLFAAVAYLVMRGSWMLHRDMEDEFPDEFFFTRFVPLCAVVALTCMPYVWRPAQFSSPGAVLGFILLVAVWLWQCCRLYNGLATCFFAYLAFAFVAGLNPLGLPALAYVGISDTVRRWQEDLSHGQREEDLEAFRHRSSEIAVSLVASAMGLVAAVFVGVLYFTHAFPPGGIVAIVMAWWDGWLASLWPALTSEMFIALAVSVILVVAALALGRRIRATGPQGRVMAIVMASLLGVAALMMALRAVDLPERRRLEMVRTYVRQTVDDVADAKWVFTDGRFDDALRFELRRQGRAAVVLDALNAPSAELAADLRGYAPEPGERDMFAAGGAEVFKAWARERPERLVDAAWQFGGGIVRRFGKIKQRTCGSVMRSAREGADGMCADRDRAFVKFSEALLVLLEQPVTHGIPFGSVDQTLAAKCDAMLWRAARLAGERAEGLSTAGNVNGAQNMRLLMQKLDGCNASLRSQGNMLERLLPTANLVLTPRESLDVALKRADFFLAQRYANEVLVGKPGDPSAHFALGMLCLETKDYYAAARHFEKTLESQLNEPAALNNLALAYFKLERYEKALEYARRAEERNPNSPEIKKNIEEITKAMKK